MEKKTLVKIIVFAVVTILAVVVALLEPVPGLDRSGMVFLAIFIWWVMMMIVELIPNYMTCLLALVLAVVTGSASTALAFSAFSGPTFWLLVGAFGLAAALANSGLLSRIALNVMRLFPGTYAGQVIGLAVASLVCAPCVPSTTAKCTILVPLAGVISDKMGYQPHSKGATGLFSVVSVITNQAGCMFLTGGVMVGIIIAISGESFSWFGWLKIFFIWGLVVVGLIILFCLFYYRPGKHEGQALAKHELQAMVAALGPMDKKELSSLVILVLTIGAWMTEGVHGVPTYAIALLAWMLMAVCGLFSIEDFTTKIIWPIVVQVGGILGIITLLDATGVGSWLSGLFAPLIITFVSHPLLLIAMVSITCTILMFAIVQGPVSAAVFVALLANVGISPVLISFTAVMSAQVFVFSFQLATIMAAEGVYGGRVIHRDVVPTAWAYLAINLVALLISVPWWQSLGLIA